MIELDNERLLAEKIKRANREIYNRKSPDKYNENESIFNPTRQQNCRRILTEAASVSGNDRYLDIGTGTGNLLKLSVPIFENCYGIDISENMLIKIRPEFESGGLAASDAESLPFVDDTFNCTSCYALLHHLYEHEKLFRECFRVLKNGGTLYTDHDPNYFFTRFYRIFYRMKFRNRPGFGTELEDFAEYHNAKSPGINPESLKRQLHKIGFTQIAAIYRHTDRSDWKGIARIAAPTLRILSSIVPAKTFYTHFSIIAIK